MNRFKLRNFDKHHDKFSFPDVSEQLSRDLVVSDSQYDRSRFVTHAFLPSSDGRFRYCSSIELAFSTSPDVVSYVPLDLRSKLQTSVFSRPSPSNGLSDDDLLRSVPSSFGHERAEAVAIARLNSDSIPVATAPAATAPADTAPADTAPAATAPAD